jgi:hypothetical protein
VLKVELKVELEATMERAKACMLAQTYEGWLLNPSGSKSASTGVSDASDENDSTRRPRAGLDEDADDDKGGECGAAAYRRPNG